MLIQLRCDISIALHKGTKPVFDFPEPLQPIIYQLQAELYSAPILCPAHGSLDSKYHYTKHIPDRKLAETWDTLSNFCDLVNWVAVKNIKLSDQILINVMGSVMYALLEMSFPTNPVNEAIRLGLLAFCSHSFLERRGIHLPKDDLCERYKICLTNVNTRLPGDSELSLWFLVMGKISIFPGDSDDSVWVKSRIREQIGLKNDCSWPKLRLNLKSFLWIDIIHDAPGKMIFESVSLFDGNSDQQQS
jgi:hypothetical protein